MRGIQIMWLEGTSILFPDRGHVVVLPVGLRGLFETLGPGKVDSELNRLDCAPDIGSKRLHRKLRWKSINEN